MSLTAEDLAFGYARRRVGGGLSLTLERGEILCVVGPNGSGKTTLFRTLLGLLPPLAGRVLLDGRDAATLGRRALARAMAYVPQAHTGFFPFTVGEMVLMGRAAHIARFDAPTLADEELAGRALAELGLSHLADVVYTRTSMGERQMTLIARAIAQESEVLVLDEPTASLDLGNQMRVLSCLIALSRSEKAIVFSTHHPDQAFLCADRVALLQDGRLLAIGAPETVLSEANLRTLYGVDVSIVEVVGRDGRRRRACLPEPPAPPGSALA